MKHLRFHTVVVVTAVMVVVTALSFAARSSRGQAKNSRSKATTKPVVHIEERTNASSAFVAAADKNSVLRSELNWTFGGKQQRGWYLYDLLIGKSLNTEHEPITNSFASALASWQTKRGLGQTGVLDEGSLMAMVSQWQGDRLKNRTVAEPSQLLTAPASDFFDPERAPELRQVERETYAAYKKMIAAAMDDSELKLARSRQYLKIVSAFRSRDYQDNLRRQSPNSGSAGLAVNSPHFTGRALDLYVGGSPVDTKDSNRAIQVKTPAYQWLVKNAERFGFRPYFYEPWHWEYVK